MTETRADPKLKERLVDKSFEAYVLALETINRITVRYRLEAFCYLICNAWELLLKAKILDGDGKPGDIYYKSSNSQARRRTLSLRDCLNRVVQNQNDPVRRNIERIEELRDEAVHLVISQVPPDVLGLFQACVINYHNSLNDWFGVSLTDRVPVGMMSIVYGMRPEESDLSNARLRQKLGRESADFLSQYCAEIRKEFDQLQQPPTFSIGIDYNLVLTKKADEADIVLSTGQSGRSSARIVEVPKDPSKSHPFRQKEVLVELAKAIPDAGTNQHDVQCINHIYKVKSRLEYFYQGKIPGSPGQYSQSFVDWVIDRYRQDRKFFVKMRAKYKRIQEDEGRSGSMPTKG